MKNILTFTFLLIANLSFAQQIAVNEVDEFTGYRKLQTEWEGIGHKWYIYIRFSTIEGETFLGLKMITGDDAYHYSEDRSLMFKFEDGSVIELYPIRNALSCIGCGANGLIGSSGLGVHIVYGVNADQLEALQYKTVEKLRIYSDENYLEDEIKKNKKKALIKQCAQLAGIGLK